MTGQEASTAPVTIREISLADAPAMAEIALRSRADIERVGPPRPARFFSEAGQVEMIEHVLEQTARGERHYWVILVGAAAAGDISLSHLQRGALLCANIGYLVDPRFRGRGVATAALELAVQISFTELGLHRLEAGVMPGNVGSRRVLEGAGFRQIGVARKLLFIRDRWEDHLLYEIVGPDVVPEMEGAQPGDR